MSAINGFVEVDDVLKMPISSATTPNTAKTPARGGNAAAKTPAAPSMKPPTVVLIVCTSHPVESPLMHACTRVPMALRKQEMFQLCVAQKVGEHAACTRFTRILNHQNEAACTLTCFAWPKKNQPVIDSIIKNDIQNRIDRVSLANTANTKT